MYNESLFVFHSLCITGFVLIALKMGKDALISLMSIQVVLANLFVLKQINLFGMTATATDAFTIGTVMCLNVIHEYYGRPAAQHALHISFVMLLFYTGMSQLHLAYIPAATDLYTQHFAPLLALMPRISLASLFAYAVVTQLDILLYAWLRARFQDRYFLARNCFSIAVCQLLDTVLFTVLGLYGVVPDIGSVILVSYLVKLAALAIATPFLAFAKRIC